MWGAQRETLRPTRGAETLPTIGEPTPPVLNLPSPTDFPLVHSGR